MLKQNKKGFSLVELVITVAILAIGITFVLKAMTFSITATSVALDMTNALFLAKDKFQDFEFKEAHNLLSNEAKEAKSNSGKYEFKYSLNLSTNSEYYFLNSQINWETARKKESFNMQTFLRK